MLRVNQNIIFKTKNELKQEFGDESGYGYSGIRYGFNSTMEHFCGRKGKIIERNIHAVDDGKIVANYTIQFDDNLEPTTTAGWSISDDMIKKNCLDISDIGIDITQQCDNISQSFDKELVST